MKGTEMINCENMTTEINGDVSELFVEYTLITRTLYEKFAESYGNDKAKKKVERAYSLGIMSEAELDAETNVTPFVSSMI